MLEQLKQRWISKLNDLCLGITNGTSNGISHSNSVIIKGENESWIPVKNEIFSPVLEGVRPVKLEGNNRNNKQKNLNTSPVIQSNLVPIISSKEMRNVNELETEYEYCQKELKKRRSDAEQIITLSDSSDEFDDIQLLDNIYNSNDDNNNAKKTDSDDGDSEGNEDDFGDVSWDIVAPNNEENTANIDVSSVVSSEDDEQNKNDVVSDQGSDLGDVSELEDEEPECNDVIIGHFERIVRPYSRKQNQKGKWRVKLRNGIAQIANQEIPFDTLVGEFEF
ncbi:hypothetical protein FG386_003064 [Cryptosporidium ryanae]|uniref:uncharacterized protein n=1 Tax=Cryptosporidium ryanae TaxID=515981 RepID=UPI00351A1D9C|nr:hypothetical protein FG386_003064 [Cryptosporidium ryanae]